MSALSGTDGQRLAALPAPTEATGLPLPPCPIVRTANNLLQQPRLDYPFTSSSPLFATLLVAVLSQSSSLSAIPWKLGIGHHERRRATQLQAPRGA